MGLAPSANIIPTKSTRRCLSRCTVRPSTSWARASPTRWPLSLRWP
ncbi:hypothetical protein GBAR_LOCUS649 [Geodia barretti]|uniref:Uncharacterized protein n=2 Tax=Geodia barretti TaxID=519541 RepID=A0AA35QU69_GEOBA|nr:hypothetical protein GBAR_LOCUS649 [Geodia barretti]